jgi:hypothetical protein
MGTEARTVELASSFLPALVPSPLFGAAQLSVHNDGDLQGTRQVPIGSSSEQCVSADGDPTEAQGDADGEGLAAVLVHASGGPDHSLHDFFYSFWETGTHTTLVSSLRS